MRTETEIRKTLASIRQLTTGQDNLTNLCIGGYLNALGWVLELNNLPGDPEPNTRDEFRQCSRVLEEDICRATEHEQIDSQSDELFKISDEVDLELPQFRQQELVEVLNRIKKSIEDNQRSDVEDAEEEEDSVSVHKDEMEG